MTKLLLVRHGHVEGISPERFRGRHDMPLSELGLLEARAVARYIAAYWQPSCIYTSPLRRCVQTGYEIAALCGGIPESLEDLNDLDYGEWQWLTHADVHSRCPEQFQLWKKAPDRVRFPRGESLQDVSARVADALRLMLRCHANKTVVVAGHDSSNRALLLHLLHMPLSSFWRLRQDLGSLSEVDVSTEGARLCRLNETHHLRAVAL